MKMEIRRMNCSDECGSVKCVQGEEVRNIRKKYIINFTLMKDRNEILIQG